MRQWNERELINVDFKEGSVTDLAGDRTLGIHEFPRQALLTQGEQENLKRGACEYFELRFKEREGKG